MSRKKTKKTDHNPRIVCVCSIMLYTPASLFGIANRNHFCMRLALRNAAHMHLFANRHVYILHPPSAPENILHLFFAALDNKSWTTAAAQHMLCSFLGSGVPVSTKHQTSTMVWSSTWGVAMMTIAHGRSWWILQGKCLTCGQPEGQSTCPNTVLWIISLPGTGPQWTTLPSMSWLPDTCPTLRIVPCLLENSRGSGRGSCLRRCLIAMVEASPRTASILGKASHIDGEPQFWLIEHLSWLSSGPELIYDGPQDTPHMWIWCCFRAALYSEVVPGAMRVSLMFMCWTQTSFYYQTKEEFTCICHQ